MQGRTRRATATGAAVFVLAGSAAIAAPGTAAASTINAGCGQTVTAHPGDQIQTPFGLKTVTDGLTSLVGGLLGGLCQVTVNVVDTVVAPVPVLGAPVAGAAKGAVGGVTNGVTGAVGTAGSALSGQPAPQNPPSGGNPQSPPGNGGQAGAPGSTIPDSNSPVLGGNPALFGSLPADFAGGYAPMRDYSTIPMAYAGLFAPSPGIRYGGQVPGYAPEFGILGQDGKAGNSGVQNAGNAETVPDHGGSDPVGLPMLLAVLALSGVSAGLVRTWVLRKSAA
jgi:hypothetical protein